VSPVKYELGFYIPEDDTLHRHCRENLKSYKNGLIILAPPHALLFLVPTHAPRHPPGHDAQLGFLRTTQSCHRMSEGENRWSRRVWPQAGRPWYSVHRLNSDGATVHKPVSCCPVAISHPGGTSYSFISPAGHWVSARYAVDEPNRALV
jgi:hypothetical protein